MPPQELVMHSAVEFHQETPMSATAANSLAREQELDTLTERGLAFYENQLKILWSRATLAKSSP